MKLFISWSGAKSRIVAEALRTWLPRIFDGAEPWMSAHDLESGDHWPHTLAKELAETSFGVLCLTKDNTLNPWVNFEAGCLAKQIQHSRVIPYLIDIEKGDLSGPLSQFQAEYSDQTGTRRLCESIRKTIGLPKEDVFRDRFGFAWPRIQQELAKATAGMREDPDSEVALSLCYLLLEKRYLKEVAERLGEPRRVRGLPKEWLETAATLARLSGNPYSERLLTDLGVFEGRFSDTARYELAILKYGRGGKRSDLAEITANCSWEDARIQQAFESLLAICSVEEQSPVGDEFLLPKLDLRKPDSVDRHLIYSASRLGIIAAAMARPAEAEQYFDVARRIPDFAGTRISGYPFVQLLAQGERLLADTIAGIELFPGECFSEKTLNKVLAENSLSELRGHLHVMARYAKTLVSSRAALATLEQISRGWKKPLRASDIRDRVIAFRRLVLSIAGNP